MNKTSIFVGGGKSYLRPAMREVAVSCEQGFASSGFTNEDVTEVDGAWDD